MNSIKYYTDNQTNYQQGNGTLYYTPGGGTPDTHTVNWMSTVNFSRTDRTKDIAIIQNSEGGLTKSFTIDQSHTDIAILLDDVIVDRSFCTHGNTNGETTDTPSYIQTWSFNLNSSHLGKTGYIIVLVNGNVIDVSLDNQTGGGVYPIAEVGMKEWYEYSTEYDYHTHNSDNNNPEEIYQDYPGHINSLIGEIYQLDNIRSYNSSKPEGYDTISGNNGIVTIISPDTHSLCYDNNIYDYGKNVGLVAIKIPFEVSSQIPTYGNKGYYTSRIDIKTAVYDRNENTGVNSNENEYRQITIFFGYTDAGPSLDDIDDLQFNPAGISDGSHNPSITINSNRPWTVVPQV